MTHRLVVPYRRWHSKWLAERGESEGGFLMPSIAVRTMLEDMNSWTVFADDAVVACGGTIEMWPGRHTAWMQLNKTSGPHMLFITRVVLKALSRVKGRVELSVQRDFRRGHKWAHMLGFCIETMDMLRYGPNGETHTAYVRFD